MKNKTTVKYFLISLKRNIPFVIFNLIIFSLVYIVPLLFILLEKKGNSEPTYPNYNYRYNLSTNYGYLITVLAIYAVVGPVICFKYLSNKKQIDTFYSLPLSREKISIVNLLISIICIIVPFTLVYFTGSVMTLIFYPEVQYIYYVVLYFILIAMFVMYYMFNAFFYTRANKVVDGCLTVLFANFTLILIVCVVNQLFTIDFINNDDFYFSFLPFMGFAKYGNYFNNLIVAKYNYKDYMAGYNNIKLTYTQWYSRIDGPAYSYIIVLSILFVIVTVLFFVLHKKRKPENAGEISNSKFGLQVLTPTICTCLAIIFQVSGNLLLSVIVSSAIAILYLCATAVELNTIRFPLYKILMLIGISILSFL